MRSGQLARQSGVSTRYVKALRASWTLASTQRTAGNYREYRPTSPQRVELNQRALTIGFSLAELKTILTVRDKGGAPCRHVRDLLRSKILDLDQQISNLVFLRAEMNRLVEGVGQAIAADKTGSSRTVARERATKSKRQG